MPQRILKTEPGHRERVMPEGRERDGGQAESHSLYSHAPHDDEEAFSGFEDFTQGDFGSFDLSSISPLWEKFKSSSDWLKLGLIGLAVVGLYIGLDESRKKKFFS